MSDNSSSLSDNQLFQRLVAALPRLVKDRIIAFRFSRGGAFRVAVTRERIKNVQENIIPSKMQFDACLSEILQYMNAIAFDRVDELIENPRQVMANQYSTVELPNKEQIIREMRSRIEMVRTLNLIKVLVPRARMRKNVMASTIDDLTWSIVTGQITSSDKQASHLKVASLALTIFRPSSGREYGNNVGISLTELTKQQSDTINFFVDEFDLEDIIEVLENARKSLIDAV